MKIAYEEHDRRDQRAVPDRVARSSRAMTVGRLVPKLVRPIGLPPNAHSSSRCTRSGCTARKQTGEPVFRHGHEQHRLKSGVSAGALLMNLTQGGATLTGLRPLLSHQSALTQPR